MRSIVLFAVVALAPLLTSCQSSLQSSSPDYSYSYSQSRKPGVYTTTPSPFNPTGPLVSAKYVPPKRYYGYGGDYSSTRTAAAGTNAADDYNFLYGGDLRCYRHRHCYSSSYCGSYGGYGGSYCNTGYYRRW